MIIYSAIFINKDKESVFYLIVSDSYFHAEKLALEELNKWNNLYPEKWSLYDVVYKAKIEELNLNKVIFFGGN